MGRVYRARDERQGRRVAIKVPSPGEAPDSAASRQFLDQELLLERIHHRAVVRLHEGGMTPEGQPYVVLEYLEGRDLARLVATKRRLAAESVVRIGIQLGHALLATHGAGLVHCDVKPSNVVLLEDGGERTGLPLIKLVDFGSARPHREPVPALTSQRTASTLEYIAPEVLLGRTPFSPLSDIYAVGCVLYELLTGRPPFIARTRAETRLAILHDDPPPVAGVPHGLWELLSTCLSKQPEQRPASGDELAARLQLLVPDEEPPSAVRRIPAGLRSQLRDR